MLLSLMLGLALHGFLIRGMPQILCSQSPPPKNVVGSDFSGELPPGRPDWAVAMQRHHSREKLSGVLCAGVTAGQGGPGGSETVGKRKVWVRFNIYSEAVLEWEGKRSSHLVLRLVEKVLCLV